MHEFGCEGFIAAVRGEPSCCEGVVGAVAEEGVGDGGAAVAVGKTRAESPGAVDVGRGRGCLAGDDAEEGEKERDGSVEGEGEGCDIPEEGCGAPLGGTV